MFTLCCPVCGTDSVLLEHELGYGCSLCRRIYPRIDDTLILLEDVSSWFAEQGHAVLMRKDIPDTLWRYLLRFPSPYRNMHQLLATYMRAPKSELHHWVEQEMAPLKGAILDVGCGLGLHERTDVVGVDLNWSLIQHFTGTKIIADILRPPFSAGSADAILALNILDSVRDPFLLLQQLDALLRPGGILLLSCAFAWADHVTPPEQQLSEEWTVGFWQGRKYEIVKERCQWILPVSLHSETIHSCFVYRLTKSSAG